MQLGSNKQNPKKQLILNWVDKKWTWRAREGFEFNWFISLSNADPLGWRRNKVSKLSSKMVWTLAESQESLMSSFLRIVTLLMRSCFGEEQDLAVNKGVMSEYMFGTVWTLRWWDRAVAKEGEKVVLGFENPWKLWWDCMSNNRAARVVASEENLHTRFILDCSNCCLGFNALLCRPILIFGLGLFQPMSHYITLNTILQMKAVLKPLKKCRLLGHVNCPYSRIKKNPYYIT